MTCPLCGETDGSERHLVEYHLNPRSRKIEVSRVERNGFLVRDLGEGKVERVNDGKKFSNVWIRDEPRSIQEVKVDRRATRAQLEVSKVAAFQLGSGFLLRLQATG
ncbi:MAG: hypothetical protein JRN59_07145 [Nitrososphaerota archaeon]|nr:hypothetical protein [Nitrososphaerota archaeon]